MKNYLTYLELTDEERQLADALYFLLGTGLEDKVFFRTATGIDAMNAIAVDQVYADTWGFFCFEHRKAFKRGEACCNGEFVYPMRTQAMAEANLAKLTLREQYLQPMGE